MRMNGNSIWLITGLALGFAGGYFLSLKMGGCAAIAPTKCTPLRCANRKLIAEHIWWTRMAILSIMGNTPDKAATLDRLMKNQDDIGAEFAKFYGTETGNKLAELLKNHEKAAGEYIEASLKKEDVEAKLKAMLAGVDPIAEFLSRINPHWPLSTMHDMWHKHIDLIHESIDDRLQQKWVDDINTWDQVFDEGMQLADLLTEGLDKQFPNKAH